jgi:hypothetical protein
MIEADRLHTGRSAGSIDLVDLIDFYTAVFTGCRCSLRKNEKSSTNYCEEQSEA